MKNYPIYIARNNNIELVSKDVYTNCMEAESEEDRLPVIANMQLQVFMICDIITYRQNIVYKWNMIHKQNII